MTNRANTAVPLTVPSAELEASVDAVVALCDGDQRAALPALVAANDYLNAEVERLGDDFERLCSRKIAIVRAIGEEPGCPSHR